MRTIYTLTLAATVLLTQLMHSSSLRCVPCGGKHRCPTKVPVCLYGLVTDICQCCIVCGKGEGDICGGLWHFRGKCGNDLVCVKPQTYPQREVFPEGRCHHHPSTRPLLIEEEEDGNFTTIAPTVEELKDQVLQLTQVKRLTNGRLVRRNRN